MNDEQQARQDRAEADLKAELLPLFPGSNGHIKVSLAVAAIVALIKAHTETPS